MARWQYASATSRAEYSRAAILAARVEASKLVISVSLGESHCVMPDTARLVDWRKLSISVCGASHLVGRDAARRDWNVWDRKGLSTWGRKCTFVSREIVYELHVHRLDKPQLCSAMGQVVPPFWPSMFNVICQL